MGRKINAIAYRLNHPYTQVDGLVVKPKRGLGHHLDGWVTTLYSKLKSSVKGGSVMATAIRGAAEEWCATRSSIAVYDGTYVLTSPVFVLMSNESVTVETRIIKTGDYVPVELATTTDKEKSSLTSSATAEVSPSESQVSQAVALSPSVSMPPLETLLRQSLLRQRHPIVRQKPLHLNRIVDTVPGDLHPELEGIFDSLDDTPRVSAVNRLSLLYMARTAPLAEAIARSLAMALEDVTGQQAFLNKLQLALVSMDKFSGFDRLSRDSGFEIDIRGTFDGSRRTMSMIMHGGKLSRGTVTVATSHAESVAKTKTGTRGIKVLYSFSGDLKKSALTNNEREGVSS